MSGARYLRVATLAIVGATVSAACGTSASPAPSAGGGASGAPSEAPSVAPGSAAHIGGTLSIAFESDIQYLDPALGYDFVSFPAERLMFETLVTYDAQGTLIPWLAAEMPAVSPDGLTYKFKLRPGIEFVKTDGSVHREMTAHDVVFSLNRILDPDLKPNPSPVGPAFFAIIAGAQDVLEGRSKTASGLKAIDPQTVEITLNEPNRTFLNIMAMPFASAVPADLAGEDAAAFGNDPVGTGPFYLESYAKGEQAVFQRNPHYWREGFPRADTIDFRLIVSVQNQLQQAKLGQLDIMGDQIAPGDYDATMNDPRFKDQVLRAPQVAVTYLSIDTSGPSEALNDVRVRQAMNHAIDRDEQVRLLNGRGVPAGCIFPPNMPAYDPTCNPYPYDVGRAQALMREAGWEAGFSTQLYTDTTEASKAGAEAIQADLARIGIGVEIVLQDFDTLIGTISTPHQAPLVQIGWFQDFPDPSDFIDPILSCAAAVEGGVNSAWYCNEEVDRLSAEARRVLDPTRWQPAYQEIQRMIMADAPWVPLFYQEWVTFRSARVPGYTALDPVWSLPDLAAIEIVE